MSAAVAAAVQSLSYCAACIPDLRLLLTPESLAFWKERAHQYGPGLSGALFGAGWWFWLDAIGSADQKVPFVQYLPGFVATLALLMINAVRREELQEYDAFDEGVFCRSRTWLFLSYVVSFGAVTAAVWVLLQDYALNEAATQTWPGVAGLFQVTLILAAALLFFVSRTPAEGGMDYSSF